MTPEFGLARDRKGEKIRECCNYGNDTPCPQSSLGPAAKQSFVKFNVTRYFLILEVCYFFPHHKKNPLEFSINSLMYEDGTTAQNTLFA